MASSLLSGLAVLGSIYVLHFYHMPNDVQPSACMVAFIYGLEKCFSWSHKRTLNQKVSEFERNNTCGVTSVLDDTKCVNFDSSDDVTNTTSHTTDGYDVVNQNMLEITIKSGQLSARSESNNTHKQIITCNKESPHIFPACGKRGSITITHRSQYANNDSERNANNASNASQGSIRNASQYTHFKNRVGRHESQSTNSSDESTKQISCQQIAKVLDRFFFWLFLAANVIVTVTLLAIYPAISKF